jgi:DNA helicase TIP49 (TBP-interacting protein)
LALLGAAAVGDELSGTIKTIDADAGKITVTGKDGKDVTIAYKSTTKVSNPKGKILKAKKFSLKRLRAGGQVVVTHENGEASRLVLKKGALEKKTSSAKP